MLDDDANNRFDDEDDDEDDSDNIAAAAAWNGVIQRCGEVLGGPGRFWHVSGSTIFSSRLLAVWFMGKSQYAHRPCLTEPQYR